MQSLNGQLNRNVSCRTNPTDNGIAAREEFSHIALVSGKYFHKKSKKFIYDAPCAGLLVSKLHVITSTTCVDGKRHTRASIKFGVLFYNGSDSNSIVLQAEKIVSKNQLTIIELPSEIETNDLISLPSDMFENLTSEKLILTGWTGYRYECNQQMRKWFIRRDAFKSCETNLICLSENDIINYREVIAICID